MGSLLSRGMSVWLPSLPILVWFLLFNRSVLWVAQLHFSMTWSSWTALHSAGVLQIEVQNCLRSSTFCIDLNIRLLDLLFCMYLKFPLFHSSFEMVVEVICHLWSISLIPSNFEYLDHFAHILRCFHFQLPFQISCFEGYTFLWQIGQNHANFFVACLNYLFITDLNWIFFAFLWH